MTNIIIIVLAVVLVIIGLIWSTYNGLVTADERVNEAWSDITVQLKYRADLIPNVVETVKGYAKHEKDVFKGVTEARSAAMGAKSVKEAAEAEKSMQVPSAKFSLSPKPTQSSRLMKTSVTSNNNYAM